MSRQTDNSTATLDKFARVQDVGDKWRCDVCDHKADERSIIEHCHPPDRVSRARARGVTGSDDSNAKGFVRPPLLHSDVREFFDDIESAIQEREMHSLQAATSVILDRVSERRFGSPALQVFTHLVFLAQHQLLPRYPQGPTSAHHQPASIREFVTDSAMVPGSLTPTEISDSNAINTERLYRRKLYSTTPAFCDESQIIPEELWSQTTVREIANTRVRDDVVFGDGTAHNTMTTITRDWVTGHPAIDWSCAPHMMTAAKGEQVSPVAADTSAPVPEPTMMFDFAGFRSQHREQLAVVGVVVDTDTPNIEIGDKLIRSGNPDAAVLVVFPNREAIVNFLDYAATTGVLRGDVAPMDSVGEYYSRRPSIPAINAELRQRASNVSENIALLARKQVIDGIVEPEGVLPDELPPARE